MDLPINAPIACADGPCGHSTAIILNPVSDEEFVVKPANDGITQLAPREGHLWNHQEIMIPVTYMEDTACLLTLGSVATAATVPTVIIIQ